MATLTGYKIPTSGTSQSVVQDPMLPAQLRGRLDHSYVDSDDGYRWGCFGRDAGGSKINAGTGSSACADCLSRPIDSGAIPPVYAGLKYGRTGVCHQAANRILRPAGIDVARIRGYPASLFVFGQYGRGGWPQWQQCARNIGVGPVPPSQGGPISDARRLQSRLRLRS